MWPPPETGGHHAYGLTEGCIWVNPGYGSPLFGSRAPVGTYWSRKLQEAERELDAATTRTAINAAVKRMMLAKAELKPLERKAPTRRGQVQRRRL